MSIVIIDKKDVVIKTDNSTLVVDTQKIPFRLIETLIVVGKTSLSTSDIIKLTQHINILLISYNYANSAIITSTRGKSPELKLLQYRASTTSSLPIAKELLTNKIKSHIEHLKNHDIKIEFEPYNDKISGAKNLDTLLGIEGSFSKLYFGHYFSLFPKVLHKGKRSKRPPLDPLNAMLSLNYTLFYNLISINLIGHGFEPGIGFLHRPFRSHNALASDLLELLRADINAYVYDIFTKKIITQSDFTIKGGVYLKYEGRKKLWSHFREFSKTMEPKIKENITTLRSSL